MTQRNDDHEKHATAIGRLVGNLLSLELSMRFFLHGATPTPRPEETRGFDLFTVAVGDEVPENALTNYDTLGKVVRKYNASVSQDLRVDKGVIDVRDTLAHGRILGDRPAFPLRLFKFGPSTGRGTVYVTHAEILDLEWLRGQSRRISDEMNKVRRAIENRG